MTAMKTKKAILTFILLSAGAFLMIAGCKSRLEEGQAPAAQAEKPVSEERAEGEDTFKGMTLNGAGASFPFPIYSQWASRFKEMTGMKLNYQSIGSGGGIAQVKAGTVDFGASDASMKKEELDEHGLLQFPMVIGGVVPVVNLEGVEAGAVKFSPDILADIYLGGIVSWTDKRIKEINPDVMLPKKDITVVHRADGSGTTWIFTNYLSGISEEWREKVGTGKAVPWPLGVGGKGNEGVAVNVQRIAGSIGYVEFAYALQNDISYVSLRNREGSFVKPTMETFQSAAASADWENAPGFYMVLTDQPGKESWPITGASFILLHREQSSPTVTGANHAVFERGRIMFDGSRTEDSSLITPVKISVRNLSFHYGDHRALIDNTLDIAANRVTAIIGPSGCGKSTHIRVYNRIYDLYRAQRATGEVLMDGKNILSPSTDFIELRRKVGMIFQKPTPFPMSVFNNVAYALRLHYRFSRRDLAGRVEGALKDAALWNEIKDQLDKPGTALSGGQQQRLCIARAIAVEPEVLLMDEPTSAIDPIATAKIEELIYTLKSSYTIVIVTHNMQQAARVSNFTAFFYEGRIVEFGPTKLIFTNPKEKQTEDYITGRFG